MPRVGRPRQGNRHEVLVLTAKHCDGFLPLALEGERLQHGRHAVQPRHLRRACRRPCASRVCGSAGTSRRWTGAIRISAPSAMRPSLAGCRAKSASCCPNYGPIDVFWFDRDGHEPFYDQAANLPAGARAPAEDPADQPARPGHREQQPADAFALRRLLHARTGDRQLTTTSGRGKRA